VPAEVTLSVLPGALQVGQRYVIRIYSATSGDELTFAEVSFTVRGLPIALSNTPLTAVVQSQRLSVQAQGFTDAIDALPLVYTFYLRDTTNNDHEIYSGFSSAVTDVLLPQNTTAVVVSVTNAYGVSRTASTSLSPITRASRSYVTDISQLSLLSQRFGPSYGFSVSLYQLVAIQLELRAIRQNVYDANQLPVLNFLTALTTSSSLTLPISKETARMLMRSLHLVVESVAIVNPKNAPVAINDTVRTALFTAMRQITELLSQSRTLTPDYSGSLLLAAETFLSNTTLFWDNPVNGIYGEERSLLRTLAQSIKRSLCHDAVYGAKSRTVASSTTLIKAFLSAPGNKFVFFFPPCSHRQQISSIWKRDHSVRRHGWQ
jgi:hypothetical protein